MSFLPSFSTLAAPSTSTSSSSSSQVTFKPASLSYFTIFCPALKPPKKRPSDPTNERPSQHNVSAHVEAEDEDARETAREAAQILFYTSRARAALKDRMLREIGVANGMIEFCSMVSKPAVGSNQPQQGSSGKGRSWNVHSSKRRMILIEVEHGIWVHASIDLPHTISSNSATPTGPRLKPAKEYHDALLPDLWLEESIRRAWRDWVLLNGCPAHILSQKAGRAGLERSLEKYFSVWAWSWDLEPATNADVVQHRSLFADCVEGFPLVASAPRSKLVKLMQTEAAQKLKTGQCGERKLVILSDTLTLWPPTDAGCFESEDEEDRGEQSGSKLPRRKSITPSASSVSGAGSIDPETKAELLRRVVSHLTGLERERDLIRAASVSSTSDGRKRGTTGAIRERGSSSSNSKRDVRNGILSAAANNKKRIASSPVIQQRSVSASSYASSSTTESTRWSNWGSVLSGLGKLGFRGNADSSMQSETADGKPAIQDQPKDESSASAQAVEPADLSVADSSIVSAADIASSLTSSSPVAASSKLKDTTEGDEGEPSSPLQAFQQRLAEVMPIQEAGGKMWNGAELAFRGISASLGLASAPVPKTDSKADSKQADTSDASIPPRQAQGGDMSDQSRFADASFDTDGTGLDDSVVTKVSVLEPEVDVEELAEALGTDDIPQDLSIVQTMPSPDDSGELLVHDTAKKPDQGSKPHLQLVTGSPSDEPSSSSPISPTNITQSVDTASIRTASSAKAFPSISVTSAAWYNTKALRSEAETFASSSKRPSAASIFSEQDKSMDTAEPFDVSLGGASVQSEHHDFELDGWGVEQPRPFESFRAYVGESEVPISHESLALLQEDPFQCTEYRISFTTRRLLTFVLIERVPSIAGSLPAWQGPDTSALDDAWQILRRTQRILNDHNRATAAKQSEDTAVRFLHLNGPTLTFQSSLDDEKEQLEAEVQVVADAHCVSAMELMRRHGVVETFSRSSNGKTWTASRLGSKTSQTGNVEEHGNETYMVLAGKKISIVDCDTQLRKLANQYPSFGI